VFLGFICQRALVRFRCCAVGLASNAKRVFLFSVGSFWAGFVQASSAVRALVRALFHRVSAGIVSSSSVIAEIFR
jgi:hypothetical protein